MTEAITTGNGPGLVLVRVKVAVTIAAMEELLGLGEGQRVLRMRADEDPIVLWVLMEGGTEFPDPAEWCGGADPRSVETPIVRWADDGWTQPQGGERRRAKVPLMVHDLAGLLGLEDGQLEIVMVYVEPDPHIAWIVVEGGHQLRAWAKLMSFEGTQWWSGGKVVSVPRRSLRLPQADVAPSVQAGSAAAGDAR